MQIAPEALSDNLKIAYFHIPKTGGQTFRSILNNQFSDCKRMIVNNEAEATRFSTRKQEEMVSLDLIEGHFGYDHIPNIPRRFIYFSLMRNPIDRVISQFNHLMNLETGIQSASKMRQESWSLTDFVDNNDPGLVPLVNAHTFFLGGYLELVKRGISDWNILFEQAVRNLISNFHFVGILERFDEGLIYLQEHYNFKTLYENKGVTPETAKTKVSEEDLEVLEKHLTPDIELYNLAVKMLEEKLKGVTNLNEKLKALQERNQNPSPTSSE